MKSRISKIGLYTSQCILFVSIHAFLDNYHKLSYLLLCTYITSVLNWRKLQSMSLIKIVDMIFVICTLVRVTLYDSLRWGPYRHIWFKTVTIAILGFLMNQWMFYETTQNKVGLFYCKKRTTSRECMYYINVIIHTSLLHLFVPLTCSYLAIISFGEFSVSVFEKET